MRAWFVVALVVMSGSAVAEHRRECQLHDPKIHVHKLGCYDEIKSTGDHTYGSRVCLLRGPTGRCSGVLWTWNGDLEGKPYVLDDATCGGTDGKVTFWVKVPDVFGQMEDVTYIAHSFTGVIAAKALRGTYSIDDKPKKITWRFEKDGFDPLASIRGQTLSACTKTP